MRSRWPIRLVALSILLAAAGLVWLTRPGRAYREPVSPDETAIRPGFGLPLPPEGLSGIQHDGTESLVPDRFVAWWLNDGDTPLEVPADPELGFPDHFFRAATPWVLDRQGQYDRASDVFRSDEPTALELQSDWVALRLFPDQPLPSLRMRVQRDPESGEYQLIGGGIALPGTGWEFHYEEDPEREERRGVFQWKKSF